MRRKTAVALIIASCALLSAAAAFASSSLPYLSWFPKGQCTRWAYLKRPDIVSRGVRQYGITSWNADRWAANARREGYVVNWLPQVGDIAMFPAGVDGAGTVGHVAYVNSVMAGQTIKISEVNWNGSPTVTQRTLTRREQRGLQFIHEQS